MAKLFIRQYAKILYHATQGLTGKDLDAAVVLFITFLRGRQTLKKVNVILDDFVKYAHAQEGIDTVAISTARTLPKTTAEEIARAFSKNFELEQHVDESLIGGVKIQKKNTVYDASIKLQLMKLKEALSN